MAVLYRKYRPQTFTEVLGQKHVVQTLKNQVLGGSVAHAYLFTGGRGIGKTSIARILAKAVNCPNVKDGNPCGKCEVCKQIEAGQFLDLTEIDAASNTGVDNIRELIEHVKFSPAIGKYKVFIVDEVHMLSKGAFNALLKTLEEPPGHAIFVLATTEINKVPATIISRTQRFDFTSPSVKELAEHLAGVVKQEKLKLKPEIVELVAQNAQGSTRDALSLLDKVLSLGDNPAIEDCLNLLGVTDISLSENLLNMISAENVAEIPAFFESLMERGTDFSIFNKDFLEYLRKTLVLKVAPQVAPALSPEHTVKLKELAGQLSLQETIFVIRLFLRSYKELPNSPSPEIPLLLAALEACGRKPQNPINQTSLKQATSPVVQKKAPDPISPPAEPVSQFAFTQVLEPAEGAPVIPEPVFEVVDETASIADIQDKWDKIVAELKELNVSLGNLVKNSPLQKVEGGKVFLGVKFLFHKQNLESQKNLQLICNTIKKYTGKNIGLCALIIKDAPIEHHEPEAALADALSILGGEVVE
jgi:DNA polymerase-3 subunit gamma/tau